MFCLVNVLNEFSGLPQALEVQEVCRRRGLRGRGWERVIRPAHGDGGMMTVRQTNNEIRIRSSPDANQFDLLAAERVVRMDDSYKSRRGLGRTGSVL